MYVCTSMYVCMYVCVYVCMYVDGDGDGDVRACVCLSIMRDYVG